MTIDGYTLVACHELGHHLGGAPLFSGQDWASVEGEADYFATTKCVKAMWGHASKARMDAASQVLANTLARLEGSKNPKASTPDRSVVTSTFEDHPAAQCRLDTYLAGVKCNAQGEFSMTDSRVGACDDGTVGARPHCWFKP